VENGTLAAGLTPVAGGGLRLRVASVIAALALIFAVFAMVQDRAEASPAGGAAAVAASVASAGGVGAAQIDVGGLFNQIVCHILFSIRNAFSGSFFGFVSAILNSLIVGFGCAPS
jgi:hypothetical protein